MSTADLHTLTGAYATHALDLAERAEFERHLEQCAACALEIAEFAATLARLGAAQAVRPPREFKQHVMASLNTVRQEAPHSEHKLAATSNGRRRAVHRFVLAACLAAALGAGGIALQQNQQADQARTRATTLQRQQDRIANLLTATDARTTSGLVTGGGTATLVWSKNQDAAALLVSQMPALKNGTIYQLWFNDGGTMRPAGQMQAGTTAVLLTGHVNRAIGIGVTVEPTGGSTQPTEAPVMLLPFV